MPSFALALVALALVASACSSKSVTDGATSPSVVPTTRQDSAGAAATAPSSCVDTAGDSSGSLDLVSLTVSSVQERVLFSYAYTGSVPPTGSVLFVVSAGNLQYGYKLVDGQESAHYVFNMRGGGQDAVGHR